MNTTEENIKVIVRIKPNIAADDVNVKTFLTNNQENNSLSIPGKDEYIFDKVGDFDSTQEEIFESCKSLFQSFVDGYNATIFAYGQTGSGKTFTMSGDSDELGVTKNPGLIPRGLSFIFDKVNERALSSNVEYLIKCSFVEIYNEQIYDLLDPQQQRLNIRVSITQEVYLEQCTEIIMENPKTAEEILKRGLSNRHIASTAMNRESSRSHAVFSIVLESRESQGDIDNIKKSCLHLVDLAGSERQRDTKTESLRLKEACMINKSLLALSMVIRSLVDCAKSNKTAFIAYRDSKLTLLLKDALGGNSKTSLVACVHNDTRYMSDTLSTIQFASSVKMIRNKAKINVDIHGDNETLRKQILQLREQINAFKNTPQTIQDHEFNFDLVWKKRFITAMALRSCLSMDVSALNNQLTVANNTTIRMMKSIDNLKMDIEIKDKKLKRLQDKLGSNVENNNELDDLVNSFLSQLQEKEEKLGEQIKSDQLQIQVNYLTNELNKAKNFNLLTVSDQTYTHSLLKDYNSIVESGNLQEILSKTNGNNMEIINLQEELSQSRYKYSLLKKKINSINIVRRDERRKLEAEIASIKSNLKVVDEQREAAVVDRRKTLLSLNDLRPQKFSPIKNINCRRRTQKPINVAIVEEEEEFEDFTDWAKKNDDNIIELDKIGALEDELRVKQTEIGSLEYNLKEYKKEVEELRNVLFSKENLENALKGMEEKYNIVNLALQESNESVKRLQKEYSLLEVSKDKVIKTLSDKRYSLEEEIKIISEDKNTDKEELDRVKLLMICLENEMKKMDESIVGLEKEISIKDSIIESLNNKLSDNISVYEDVAVTKNELENLKRELERVTSIGDRHREEKSNLERRIEEFKSCECQLKEKVSLLEADLQQLRFENDNFMEHKENIDNELSVLREEKLKMENDNRNKIIDLEKTHTDREYSFKCELEEKKSLIVTLSDKIEKLTNEIEDYDKENKSLRLDNVSIVNSPRSTKSFILSPKNTSSPLLMKFVKDSNSRSSLLDDLMASNNEKDQLLKDKEEIIDRINTIIENIFEDLQLPLSNHLVNNVELMRTRLIGFKHDLEDLVIKAMSLEESLKQKTDYCDSLCGALEDVRIQRDEFKKQLDEISNLLPTGGHTNHRQKIECFTKFKESNARLRSENVELMDQNNNIRIWLTRNNCIKKFEADEAVRHRLNNQHHFNL